MTSEQGDACKVQCVQVSILRAFSDRVVLIETGAACHPTPNTSTKSTRSTMPVSWQDVSRRKQAARTEAIAKAGKLVEGNSGTASDDSIFIHASGTLLPLRC